jgi:hypothetical protein
VAQTELNLDILGTSGLRRSGGYVLEEFLRQLKGPRGVELLREFTMNSPQAGALRALIHSLVRQVRWEVQVAKEATDVVQAEEARALVESCMNDMSHTWDDFIAEVLSMVEFGWAYFELVYKFRRGPGGPATVRSKHNDGRIGWRKAELRSQDSLDRWEFDPETFDLRGMWQRDNYANRYVFIPIERAVLFRTEKFKNNPEGRSMYRNAIVPYLRLKHIEDVEAIGVERDLTGLPTMEVPIQILAPDASSKDRAIRAQLEKQLGEVKRDEREFLLTPAETGPDGKPTGWRFKLQSAPGQRQFDIVRIKDSYKTDILQTFLAQFLQLGVQANSTGSFALASSSTNLFALALGAVLDNIEETINRYMVDRLLELNGFAPENFCTIEHGDIETPPLGELGQYLQSMFAAGLLEPSEALKQKAHDLASLPFEPQEMLSEGEVKTADQLVQEVLAGGDPLAQKPTDPNAPAAPGQQAAQGDKPVQTADQLVANALPAGHPQGAKTADQLIEEARGK